MFKLEKKYWIISLFVAAYMLTVLAFFVNGRFRLPVLPLLIVAAAWAVWKGVDYIRTRDIRKVAAFAAAFAILLALTAIDFFGISNESFAMSHFSLGNVYLKKGMQDAALEEYSKAIAMAPCVPKAHLNRGVIFFSRNDFARAEEEFTLELGKCQISAEAHNNLSVLKRLNGDPGEALRQADLAIAQKINYPEAYLNRILALRQLNQDSAAFETVQTLVAYFPDFAAGRYYLGMALIEQGRIDDGHRQLEIVRGLPAANVVERYDLSTIYAAQAGYGYRLDRIAGLACYELGLLAVRAGDIETALGYFREATQAMPDHADSWVNLALAYDHQRRYQEALEAFKTGIGLAPTNAVAYYNLGLTLAKIGRFSDAANSFRQALDLDPSLTQAREKLELTESILNSSGQK
jgi:tetratricopeptide (TPR) repeat protein